eukprot:TRINITY_DN782_c0_g1_i3.p1 TRINITY_DN782_c0_g1~~TRINITY_DN782_c0_g1_i3.p1  ORF type:complete len:159 (-),score=32.97 TRINITY_DN782_c0_g1_i3:48-524(-)
MTVVLTPLLPLSLSLSLSACVLNMDRYEQCPDFEYLVVKGIEDVPSAQLSPYFEQAADYIHQCLQQGHDDTGNEGSGAVLVHCMSGVSRSATLVVAYLIKYHSMMPQDAINHIRQTRRLVQPNSGFCEQLNAWGLKHRVFVPPPVIKLPGHNNNGVEE